MQKFGEQIKLPIDRKKRPLLLKKLNHYRAKERAAIQPKKTTPSRKKQQAEFSSEESEEENETGSSSFGRIFGRPKKLQPSNFYSNTNTIEISPSSSKDDTKSNKRNTRRSFNSQSETNIQNSTKTKSKLYPDLSEVSSLNDSYTGQKSIEKPNEDALEYSYEQDFTDSDPDESSYEVVNKSVNTTFVDNNQVEEPTLHQTRTTTPNRGTPVRKSAAVFQKSVLVQRQKQSKSTINNINKVPQEEPEEPLEDAFQTEEKAIETSSSYVSSILVLLVAIFFLSISLTYVYLRRDYLFHEESDTSYVIPPSYKGNKEKESSALDIARNISDYIHQQPLDKSKDVKNVSKSAVETIIKTKKEEDFLNGLHIILANPKWSIRLYDKDNSLLSYTGKDDKISDIHWLVADRDKSLIERLWDSAYRIFIGFVLLLSCVIAGIIGLLILRFYNKSKEEEQKKVYNMVEQIIDVIKDNFEEANEGENNVPSFMAIQHVRDQLLPISKRKKMLPIWEKAVKFIEANESRIRVESQTIQGEEFLVWKWLPVRIFTC